MSQRRRKPRLTAKEKIDRKITELSKKWADAINEAEKSGDWQTKRRFLFEAAEIKDQLDDQYRRRRRFICISIPDQNPRLF